MPVERYYYPQEFQEDTPITLEEVEFHHLVNVMRNRVGDSVDIVNGLGQLAKACIIQIDKKRCSLKIESIFQAPLLNAPLILVQALPRLSKLEIILEKATELGVTEIWLFPAAHTEKKEFSKNQLERLHAILISAMKQCGALFIPELIFMPSLKDWQPFYLPAYFGDIDPKAASFIEKWMQKPPKEGSIFCIGPESGFTDEEIVLLKKLGAEGVKLNNNILRTETAAIAAIALMSHLQGCA